MILNQINTGMPCPNEVEALKQAIEKRDGRSMMQYIKVYCFTLAMVLDRLEYLEQFEKTVKDVVSRTPK
jgi:hypothetical protein